MDLVFSRTRKIPNKSWGQECSLCSSRHGVPIECSARGCKAAYHTTCAIRGKLKMQAIFGKNFKGGIKLRSYCKEHSPSVNIENGISTQDDKIDASGVKEIDMTNLADDRLQEGSEELDYFWKYVDINEVHRNISNAYARARRLRLGSSNDDNSKSDSAPRKNSKKFIFSKADSSYLGKKNNSPKKVKPKEKKEDSDGVCDDDDGCGGGDFGGKFLRFNYKKAEHSDQEVDPLMLDLIYRYWMLLRTANNGQSLIKFSPSALKEREFEQRKSILKLRIELERVRNLSYMIGKREKLKASWLKTHQNIIKRTFSVINDLNPTSDVQSSMLEAATTAISTDNHVMRNHQTSSHNNHNQHHTHSHNHNSHNHHHPHNHHHHHNHHNNYSQQQGSPIPPTSGKKSLHSTIQHLQQTNGMFDESGQLINDLITCDQIYELPNSSTNSNYSNLSHQEQSTLERRRTLSLVRRINRQLKSVSVEPSLNPYAKSYLVPKRSDSPVGLHQPSPAAKMLKYR